MLGPSGFVPIAPPLPPPICDKLSFRNCSGDVGPGGASMSATECTVVTFTFGEEPVPYRSKISGRTVTLRQFKDILPKKGNYKCVDNH